MPIAAAFAPTIGADGYTGVTVPHPVSSIDDDTLRDYAERIVDEVERRLTVAAN